MPPDRRRGLSAPAAATLERRRPLTPPAAGDRAQHRDGTLPPVSAARRGVILGGLALLATAVLGRTLWLQTHDHDFLFEKALRQQHQRLEIPARRAALRDRRGMLLAMSAPVDSVCADPTKVPFARVPELARLLQMTPAEVQAALGYQPHRGADGAAQLDATGTALLDYRMAKLKSGKSVPVRFVYLKRALQPEDAAGILAIANRREGHGRTATTFIPGLCLHREYKRYYPAGEAAAHVVGFTGGDAGGGIEGAEAALDNLLTGKPGYRVVMRSARGEVVEETGIEQVAAPAEDLRLTLDLRLQYLAYRELKAAVERHHAQGGLIVLADARTGELLAMAAQPGFNPNLPRDPNAEGFRNRALTDRFEPGSTVKPLVIATALEAGRFAPNSHIDTGRGFYRVNNRLTVHDDHACGVVDMGLLLAKSSNVGAAIVGLSLGPEKLHDSYVRFGLDEKADLGFPGEATPLLRPAARWGLVGTATASYGYGFSISALQMVRAYTALAGDGHLRPLRLVLGQPAAAPVPVISPATAATLRQLMRGAVSAAGTAQRATVPGYSVTGKTGTIRKVMGGQYSGNHHQSAFIGMMPADHPRLIGLVMIDEPAQGEYYGGLVAAPVFSSVMQGAARMLQIPQDLPITNSAPEAAPALTAGAEAPRPAPGAAPPTPSPRLALAAPAPAGTAVSALR